MVDFFFRIGRVAFIFAVTATWQVFITCNFLLRLELFLGGVCAHEFGMSAGVLLLMSRDNFPQKTASWKITPACECQNTISQNKINFNNKITNVNKHGAINNNSPKDQQWKDVTTCALIQLGIQFGFQLTLTNYFVIQCNLVDASTAFKVVTSSTMISTVGNHLLSR